MRYIGLFFIALVFVTCQQAPQKPVAAEKETVQFPTGNFGQQVATENATATTQLATLFTSGDTLDCTIAGKISASCKHSGCWMDLDMGHDERIHVTFSDESFTIPLDAAGKNAVAQGVAIRELIPVEKLQNYAREDGKSEAEIAAITVPIFAYEFIASGVLIEE